MFVHVRIGSVQFAATLVMVVGIFLAERPLFGNPLPLRWNLLK